jgi:hypothetical protein
MVLSLLWGGGQLSMALVTGPRTASRLLGRKPPQQHRRQSLAGLDRPEGSVVVERLARAAAAPQVVLVRAVV